MQSGQVSIWIPIIVGIIGLVGVVTGQLVNAWRERKREELKWRRERHTESTKLEHDNAGRWREIRIETYTQFLDVLMELIRTGATFDPGVQSHDASVDERNKRYEQYGELRRKALELEQRVLLICSPKLYSMMKQRAPLHLLAGPMFDIHDRESWEVLFSAGGLLHFHHGFLSQARTDLGVKSSEVADPA